MRNKTDLRAHLTTTLPSGKTRAEIGSYARVHRHTTHICTDNDVMCPETSGGSPVCVCVEGCCRVPEGKDDIPECGTTAVGTWRTEPPAKKNSSLGAFALQRGKRLVRGYVLNDALRIFFFFIFKSVTFLLKKKKLPALIYGTKLDPLAKLFFVTAERKKRRS